ncbi:MAG: fructosamine kinase family protein [Flavobacteriales bacterium]|nr:fructosamine kinase family protein [Flavobacteriales bacterium]
MLPIELKILVAELLGKTTSSEVLIERVTSVGGGSINQVVQIQTTAGSYFLKFNSASLYPQMFELEKRGLEILNEANELSLPEVIGTGQGKEYAFLLLNYIDSGLQGKGFWEEFGAGLAKLHKHSSLLFGLDHNNYIGSLEQSNYQHSSWPEFFIQERLEPQIKMAGLQPEIITMFSDLYGKLEELFPSEPASLLHGDLWSGNYMTSSTGGPTLIDPAVYYGHREMDIGMSKLFGGFSPEFYSAYNAAWPLENGWENRVDICNLYPLMVHVNLFGGSYLGQVTSILKKYTQ